MKVIFANGVDGLLLDKFNVLKLTRQKIFILPI